MPSLSDDGLLLSIAGFLTARQADAKAVKESLKLLCDAFSFDCGLVYGMDGFTNMTGIVLGEKMLRAVYQVNFSQYLVRLLLFGLQGFFLLCAITLAISAKYNTSFTAVIVSAVCWGMPVILRMLLMGMSAIFIYATPLFLVMHGCLDDVYGAEEIVCKCKIIRRIVLP